MNKTSLSIVTVLVTFATPASTQQTAMGALDAEHQLLASLDGDWLVKQSFWTSSSASPKIDTGRASLTMVLNGRHLRQSVHIDDGTNFEGLGFFGYDSATKAFFSSWMDVNFSGIVIARGSFNTTRTAITLRGRMDAAQGREPIPVREVLTIIDRSHLRYDFYEAHNGVEALAVRLEYTRA